LVFGRRITRGVNIIDLSDIDPPAVESEGSRLPHWVLDSRDTPTVHPLIARTFTARTADSTVATR
jgi:hypothetical protein